MEIREARSHSEIEAVRSLFEEYQAELGIDLCFQGFSEELANLPGDYAPPGGILLLAREGGASLGCVAVRPFQGREIAELKRLFVREEGRGRHLGSRLTIEAIAFARQAGYERLRLDTLPTMAKARKLYGELGFVEIEPYRRNPVPGAVYLELSLESRRALREREP